MNIRLIIGAAFLGIITLGAAAVFFLQENLMRGLINPRSPYETYVPPPAPDYRQSSNWLLWPQEALPDQETANALSPSPTTASVFYIHSTSYRSAEHWNAPLDDTQSGAIAKRILIPNEAGPFASAGTIYTPKYRQATLFAFFTQKHSGREARKTAYEDIKRAFQTFLADSPPDRPIILVGYGQGALHAQGLLVDFFQDNEPLRRRLVAAWLIDQATPLDLFNYALAATPACKYPSDVRCVISWNAYEADFDSEITRARTRSLVWDDPQHLESVAERPLLCTNPLDWKLSSNLQAKKNHLGATSNTGIDYRTRPVLIEQAASVQCQSGIAIISRPRQRWLRRPRGFGRQWSPLNYNLFYENIRQNALARLEVLAKIRTEEEKSAPPMNTPLEVIASPIRKVPG